MKHGRPPKQRLNQAKKKAKAKERRKKRSKKMRSKMDRPCRISAMSGAGNELETAAPLASWVPAGWYPDPLGVAAARYWDGTRWSKRSRDAPPPDPIPAAPTSSTDGQTYCTECGAAIPDGAKFCKGCGHAVASAASTATATSGTATGIGTPVAHRPPEAKAKKWPWVVVISVILIIIGAATSGGGSKSSSSSSAVSEPASESNSPAPATKSTPDLPQSEKDARAWIKKHGPDSYRVQANVLSVQVAIIALQHEESEANLNEVAQTAQTAHDRLDEVRDDFASGEFSGAMERPSLEAFSSANDLKNSMGAMVSYTGNPNPATLAHFTTQYRDARAGWNDGVKTIWHLAHKSGAPTI